MISEAIGNPLPLGNGFEELLDWRAQAARLNQNLITPKINSEYLGVDQEVLNQMSMDDWINKFNHPLVFAYLAEKYCTGKTDQEIEVLLNNTLGNVSKFDNAFNTISGSQSKILSTQPDSPVILNALRMKGKGSRKEHCLGAMLLLKGHPKYKQYQTQVHEALLMLQIRAPGYYNDFNKSVQYIVLVTDASFRGSSSLYHLGLIYLCPDDGWTTMKWMEELVHESSHQILEYLAYENKIFFSDELDSQLKFSAPLREDKRPPYGIIHALFVVARINCLYSSILLYESELNEIKNYVSSIVKKSLSTLEQLMEARLLTPFGEMIVKEYIEPNLKLNDRLSCGK